MKQRFVALALGLALVSSAAAPRNANATASVVALVAGGPAGILALSGAASFGGGILVARYGPYNDIDKGPILPMLFLGLILLDQSNTGGFEFVAIQEKQASEIGISAAEANAFNLELDEVNAIAQTVRNELSQMKSPTLEASRAAWEKYGMALSPEAMSATSKLAAQVIQN